MGPPLQIAPKRGFLWCAEGLLHFINSGSTAHFVTNDNQWRAVRAVFGANKRHAFWREVTGGTSRQVTCINFVHINREVTVADVLNELRCKWVADVVRHNATLTFQADVSVGLAIHSTNGQTFWLWTFVVGAVVDFSVVVGYVEVERSGVSDDLFELVTGIEYQVTVLVPDGEGASTVRVDFVVVVVAFVIAVHQGHCQVTQAVFVAQLG